MVKKIKKIKKLKKENYPKVYDLSVKNSELFFTRDSGHPGYTLVHNSSMYPSIGITFNISPNTYLYRMFIPDDRILIRWIYEKKLDKQDGDIEIDIIVKPMVWFGEKQTLGIKIRKTIREILTHISKKNNIITLSGAVFKNHDEELGFYSELLLELRKQRKHHQKLMKEAIKNGDQLTASIENGNQLSRKVVMNGGYYGATGAESYNFFDVGMAEAITKTARIEISAVCDALERYILACEQNVEKIA